MNTKLEVVRINEDVIATSGVCEHESKTHFLIGTYGGSGDVPGTIYDASINKYYEASVQPRFFETGSTFTKGQYYYYDDAVSKYKLCNGHNHEQVLGNYIKQTQ